MNQQRSLADFSETKKIRWKNQSDGQNLEFSAWHLFPCYHLKMQLDVDREPLLRLSCVTYTKRLQEFLHPC